MSFHGLSPGNEPNTYGVLDIRSGMAEYRLPQYRLRETIAPDLQCI